MKLFVRNDDVFGMANLVPNKTGLSVDIWSDHEGILRNIRDKQERVKISYGDATISVSISENPQILSRSHVKKGDMKYLEQGIRYVSRNYDLFRKHYEDVDDTFDDEALFYALRARGEYR